MYYKFCNEPACWIPITDARVLLQLDGGGEEYKAAYEAFDEFSRRADHDSCYLVGSMEDQ